MQIVENLNMTPVVAEGPSTIVQLLRQRSFEQGDRLAYTFLTDGEVEETTLTYSELDRRARSLAAWLRTVAAPGERVLLLYPSDLQYVTAFFACLYAGVVAVPAYPPRMNRSLDRLQSIVSDSQATVALTTESIRTRIEPLYVHAPELKSLRWLATDDLPYGLEDEWLEPELDEHTLAFLQYTSGSTSAPKGVMVTHGNLVHNQRMIRAAFRQTEDSVIVGWLPLYHDMGLIGNVLQPLYVGARCVLMSPVSFLQKPARWLQAISRFRATTSGGPNFAYELCARKISEEQRAELDLSSWRVAFNGAEPIRAETLDRFAAAFGPCGFRRTAFFPCYGLAEATLLVTGKSAPGAPVVRDFDAGSLSDNRASEITATDRQKRTLVSSGVEFLDQRIEIVNPETQTLCAPHEVGEIWVAGPSVAAGYWARSEESERVFSAYLSETGDGPFLRTGDLGFLQDGELFVTGRLKDLIIIRGLNHYPQDIERTVELSSSAVRAGGGAAFSVEVNGEERLALVQEVERNHGENLDAVFDTIRRAVSETHELQVCGIALVKRGSIPKTSSGKIRRSACRENYLNNRLDLVALWQETVAADEAAWKISAQPANPSESPEATESWLCQQVASILRVDPAQLDSDRPLTHYGLDSLAAVGLAHTIETNLGASVSLTTLLESSSIRQLAEQLYTARSEAAPLIATPITDAEHAQALSHNQQSLWFLNQLVPDSAAYNLSFSAQVKSELDTLSLRRALEVLVARHASLRTTFAAAEDGPTQQVHELMGAAYEEFDAATWSRDFLQERLVEAAHQPFDLHNGPLLRVKLYRRMAGEHVLLLVAHHIVVDFWSLAMLVHELGELYTAESHGRSTRLPTAPAQYTDFVRWQHELMASERGESHWNFWQRQLTPPLPALNLPTDRPRPPVQTYRGATQTLRLDADLSRRLEKLAQSEGTTLFTVLFAAFNVLLYRYTGQTDIVVGTPTAGRSRPQFADVVGYFVNPIALRTQLSGAQTFNALLRQVRQNVLAAFEHSDYPLAQLVKRLQPEREASRSPLFQSMFVMQTSPLQQALSAFALNEAGAQIRLGEVLLESISLEQRAAQFDLTLMMAEMSGELLASFEYNTDLFDAATIRRMTENFRTLLASIAYDVDELPLSTLPLLADEEERQLREWNNTDADYPVGECIHQLFEAQVQRTPEAEAVVFQHERLTYAELNARANRMAHFLRRAGVGPESCVGVLMERSAEMLTGMLAILKAGGAYVPLDPNYPQERLSFMLEDAQAKVLLTQERLRDKLPEWQAEIICVDRDWELIAAESSDDPKPINVPGNLAYLIYTSGSTGRPKGVSLEHGNAVTLLHWAKDVFAPAEYAGVLASTSISFDLSVFEFFVPLSWGGKVIIAENALQLPLLPAAEEVTLINTVPSAMAELARDGALPTSVRVVNLAGEPLKRTLVDAVYGLGVEKVFNLYGPSEDTTYSTFVLVPEGAGAGVTIGRPVANTRVYLLSEDMQPVPAGVPAELYIGGEGLARGYHRRPELTAERFVPNPFSTDPGSRLYRTGDVARYLANGELDYLGRVDHQVKVRGFRIELGEIEAVLLQHDVVREAVVVAHEESSGERRLVAYVVPVSKPAPTVNELRRHVKDKLPESMTPAVFIMLDEMPLTPNGKIDRKALPAPSGDRPELEQAFILPRDEVEKTLAEIWAEALGLERVGAYDNFFELGGDSILGVQIIARANRRGLHLSARDLFTHQSVAELAEVVKQSKAAEADQVVVGEVPLTPIQHWFFDGPSRVDPHHYNQSVLLEARGELDERLLEAVIRQLTEHHDALRLRFHQSEGEWRQFNAPVEEASIFTSVDLPGVDREAQQVFIEGVANETQASLNLPHGPLLKAVFFRPAAGQAARLLLVIHHLAVDGVSWRILLEDLQTGYEQLSLGAPRVSWPPKSTSYRRWAERLREYAQKEELQDELAYWESTARQQAGAVPVDFSDGLNTVASARDIEISLSVEETRALLQETTGAYRAAINEVLLAALVGALGERTVVDVEGYGREEIADDIDVSRTVGWFTTIYPVLLDAGQARTAAERLKLVKEQLRAVPNRGLNYGVLRYLGAEETAERLRKLPSAQVLFNYLGQFDQAFAGRSLFGLAPESSGAMQSARRLRTHLLEINGRVVGGQLRLVWTHSANVHEAARINSLAEKFIAELRHLIACRTAPGVEVLTPSDFPLAGLTHAGLAKLVEATPELEDIYPLSPTQEGLLFHSLLSPESGEYVEQLTCVVEGRLEATAFKRAWQTVAEGNAMLRTAFFWEGLERPQQVVSREVEVPFVEADWRGLTDEEQQRQFDEYLDEDRRHGFDFTRAPLMRVALFRIAEETYRFVWSYHHILLDGWSMPLVFGEVLAAYEAARDGIEALPAPTRPFRDYISWLQQQDKSSARAYWREYLRGHGGSALLADKRQQEAKEFAEQLLWFDSDTTAALRDFARRNRITLNTLVQGVWALLLSRYSGEEDVVFGVTVAGRPTALHGVERMVGLFINTLPLRVQIEAGVSVASLLAGLQEQQAEVRQFEHNALAEVQVWAEAQPGSPLFESILVFENYPMDEILLAKAESCGLQFNDVRLVERSNYALTIGVMPGTELLVKFNYERSRLTDATIARMRDHFETLLCAITSDADQEAVRAPMLTAAEEQQILVEWNDKQKDYPTDRCVHELFEAQAERTPEAVALVAGAESLTYDDLNRRANRLAHRLREFGVGPESRVAVCLQRSLESVVGLLGILKAGGAYLPLDPEYPADRLAFVIHDAHPLVVLTTTDLREKLSPSLAQLLCLDEESERLAQQSEENPAPVSEPEHLAYVIYTSGSTGQPKGVLVEHRNFLHTMQSSRDLYNFVATDVVPCVAPFAFDISLFELMSPLLAGGCCLLVSAREMLDDAVTLRVLEQSTILHSAPGLMWQMIHVAKRNGAPEKFLHIREAFVGGDAVSPELLREMQQTFAGARISVGYGPTEATIMCAHYPVLPNHEVMHHMIGAPLNNVTVRLYDRYGNLVPVGVAGEIYVGGAGVSRGYLNRDELTAEKFVTIEDERFYRSGDVGRYLPDGNIIFLGRSDHQVKIRGFRIEPGEIENVLSRHEAVRKSVVVAYEDVSGQKALVAYVMAEEGATESELREHLRDKLPEHMIPAAFVMLDALPLTPLGKIDRKALPKPDFARDSVERSYLAPRNEVEAVLCGIWAEVLKTTRVGVEDNFFELGGHSLLATQVISRVRDAFRVETPLRALFERPTPALLAVQVEAELRAGAGVGAPPLVAAPRDGALPLSFAQQRLWFLDQLEPGNFIYNMPHVVRLDGPFDVAAMEGAFTEIVRRHESLRTTFAVENGQPVQVINPPQPLRLPVLDLSMLPEAPREAEVMHFAAEEVKRPFDLSSGPLLRAYVLRLDDEAHVLVFTLHHIVCDGWSINVLIKEVAALYQAFVDDQMSPLPELALQYADFAVWQRQYLSGEALERQLAYWKEQLAGAPALLQLSTDRPRGAMQKHNGRRHLFTLPGDLTESLSELSRKEGATLFMTMLSTWQLLLCRYSGQDDVVVGTPIANRHPVETEPLIGFFVNMLPLRSSRLYSQMSFRELLAQVREVCLGAYAHQDLPFEKLIEELQPERSLGHSPIFQVVFGLEHLDVSGLRLPGLKLSVEESQKQEVIFDLSLNVLDAGGELSAQLEYDADLFDADRIERMAGHYLQLLREVVRDPGQRISEAQLLTDPELEQIEAWNNTARRYEHRALVHQLVSEQAALRPHAVAVTDSEQSLTYAELDASSNRLAQLLLNRGVTTGDRVGVLLERSAEAIAAILAVWKAGATYLPLDPQQPESRLRFMLADGGARAVISDVAVCDWIREAEIGFELIDLDAEREQLAALPSNSPQVPSDYSAVAYVIYTSGSTGEPKGVEVEHRNLLNTLAGVQEVYGFTESDVVPCLASLTFDISLFELMSPLLAGGCCLLVGNREVLDEAVTLRVLEQSTILHSTPGLMWQMIHVAKRNGAPEKFLHIREAFVGGDAVSPELLREMQQTFAGACISVNYGPTEAAIMCAHYSVPPDHEVKHHMIGAPMGNVHLLLLDGHGRDVPVGVVGEIYIGGAGIARGYLNRPELTAERFVELDAGRYYRSGDLGRWLADGAIEFVGRADGQVKIRGYRIEIGEVEAALSSHEGVSQAAVMARGDASGEQRLVAYFVAADAEHAPGVGELREHLKQRLPEYMVPGAFVRLDEMPLTRQAKVDRHALPEPEYVGVERGAEYVAPRTATEEVLAGVWAELLGVPRVGVEDNFFMLGGHSLLATQVISRVREAFRVELPLRSIFEHPTIAGLAETIEEAIKIEDDGQLTRVERDGRAPLSFAQQRLWFLDQFEAGGTTYNVQSAITLEGVLNLEAFENALSEVVRRHEVLRTTITTDADGTPWQIVREPQPLAIEFVDLSALSEAEQHDAVLRHAAKDVSHRFDFAVGPLLRVSVVQLRDEEHVVVLTMHHIISDGWSLGVLVREIAALYEASLNGAPSPLPELPLQYADFAVWQRRWMQGESLNKQLAYWKQALSGAPAVLEMPTDRPRPAEQSFRGATINTLLSQDLTHALQELSQHEGVTLFMTLFAIFQTLLHRYSGQDDISVGVPIANRNRAETEGLIGFFVNTLVLRTDLSGDPTFTELLRRVREVSLGAYAHQEVPFERLVEELQPERSLSYAPLFQVMFALQNAPIGSLDLPGLVVRPLELGNHTARFDLSLSAEETAEGLKCSWNYNTDLFDETTLHRIIAHFEVLLRGVAADPVLNLSGAPLLAPGEPEQILVEWNNTEVDYSAPSLIHQLFETQARKTPDRVALVFRYTRWSYAELNHRADLLANYLRGLGVGPETPVGVMMERSLEMVVALFGILKAGGAYVPLDPDYPQERLAYMLEDAQIKVLLTQEHLRGRIDDRMTVCLDADWEEISALGSKLVSPPDVSGANACYVIYTSGTTGRPKGAINTHAAVCNRLLWMQDTYCLTEDDCVLQKTPYSFDVSVWEFFWPLMTGARLVIAEPGGHRDPEYLVNVIKEQQVTVLHFVPSMLKVFVENDGVEQCETLKKVMCSGEALSLELQQRFFERQKAELHNLYGPTEAAVDVTFWECQRDGEQHLVPIGKPVANTQMFILDAYMQLVPVGVAGDLYIGGVQLARGYLGQAALTAERFVPHPFSAAAGVRLYKTGDLARYRAGGEIEYLGRSDQQVKVRGFRIEPAEIEAALLTHPALASALVIARPSDGGDMRLVAYLVMAAGVDEAPAPEELRHHLLGRLPDYMVPSYFVTLEALPLLPSGKVDRRALPAVESPRAGVGREWVEPRTEAEQVLARVWAEVLGVERVGVNDNFFELGGDSILSIQVVARAAQCGLQLTAKQVFQHQTVAGLAAAAEVGQSGVTAEQGDVRGAAVLTPVQRWFFERELAEEWHHNQAVMMEVRPGVQWEALGEAMAAAMKQHDALRLRFRREENEWVQEAEVGAEACQVFELCDVSELGGAEAEQHAIAEVTERTQRGLRLDEGPVVRAVGFKRGSGRSGLLLVVAHHLVIDGVSWRVLLEDVERGYEQAAAGAEVELGGKTTSYKEWAQRLTQHADRAEVAAEAAFWLKETSRQVLHLPLDVSDSASALNTVSSARQIVSELSVEETRALLTEAPRKYRMQINEVMLAALARTLTDRSGERRVMVDVESHGREDELLGNVDLSRTVGWFTAIYPVVLESSPADDHGATLTRVKKQLRRVPARGFHYGLLRYMNSDLAIREALARSNQAEILFNYLGQLDHLLAESKLFSLTRESSGPTQSEQARRSHLLEINGVVVEGRLQLTWTYSEALHRHGTIESLTTEYMQTLRRLIAHCRRAESVTLTPSDFPLADLTKEKLDELLGEGNAVEDIYSLSSTQRGILFHHLYAPEAELYFDQLSCSLAGYINIEAFERAWQIVFDRHPILRTSFAWEGLDEPVQVVRQRVSVPLVQLDWCGIASAEQQERLQTLIEEERRRAFDISQAPLMHLTLIRQEDELYRLVWSWHHILLDGWSVSLVMQEVLSLYKALDAGREADLRRAPLYRDYIAWLQDQDMAAAETYWRNKLEGRATTTLADKVASSNGSSAKYAAYRSKLSSETTRALQSLARQNQLTLSTLVQGAWALVLSHHTRAEDVVFGVTTAGRPAGLPGVEEMVGLFINTLPLRLTIEPEDGLLDWFGRVQDELTELRQYEHTPLVQVQEWSGRGESLFDTIVAFENYPFEAALGEQIGGFRITDGETVDWNNFPLSLVVTPGDELNIGFNYHLQQFNAGTVAHLCQQFELVLRGITEAPGKVQSLLESLVQADREHEQGLVSKYKNNVRLGLKNIRRKTMAANKKSTDGVAAE